MQTGESGWPETAEELSTSLAETGLSPQAIDRIMALARPALMLATRPAEEDAIPRGATKIGGRPDLPPGMAWPERPAYANAAALVREVLGAAERFHADAGVVPPWMSAEDGAALLAENARIKADTLEFMQSLQVSDTDLDEAFSSGFTFTPQEAAEVAREAQAKAEVVAGAFPLAFLGQFDLSALADGSGLGPKLPREGRLYIFYDLFAMPPSFSPAAGIGLRVLHDRSPAGTLVRTELPPKLAALSGVPGTVLAAAAVTIRPVMTAVPVYSQAAEALALGDDEAVYSTWLSNTPGWPGAGAAGAHQLGGWRRAIQSTIEGVAQLAANGIDAGSSEAFRTPEAKRLLQDEGAWQLLFQLGPDEAIGNMLPGALNVLMREEDLAASRFERAWAVYEDS